MSTKLYEHISRRLIQIENLNKHFQGTIAASHVVDVTLRLNADILNHMPSGSGFDNGTTLNYNESEPEKLVFDTAFHHMDEHGCYDGWTHHKVIVTPSMAFGYRIRVTGENRNHIKEHIADMFRDALEYIDSNYY